MSWGFYLGSIAFFTLVFLVAYAVAYSVILGLRENYLRHYQKAEMQWTAPQHRSLHRVVRHWWFLVLSLLTAWAVVHFVIQSGA